MYVFPVYFQFMHLLNDNITQYLKFFDIKPFKIKKFRKSARTQSQCLLYFNLYNTQKHVSLSLCLSLFVITPFHGYFGQADGIKIHIDW